jgi:hypothetical protein
MALDLKTKKAYDHITYDGSSKINDSRIIHDSYSMNIKIKLLLVYKIREYFVVAPLNDIRKQNAI